MRWSSVPSLAISLALASASVGCLPSESSHIRNVHVVIPGVLVRGAQPDERGLRELRDRYGVRTVVNFNHWTATSEAKDAGRVGLNYLPLPDDPFRNDDNDAFVLAFLKVLRDREHNGTIYVHCKTGMDRT